jgi:hypothetical protein
MTTTILPTRNEAWGFWGTTDRSGFRPDRSWDVASTMIAEATSGTPEAVRDFLDSRLGRHFADQVCGEMLAGLPVEVATGEAIREWQGWRISRQTSRDEGIPRGLPYLTGWVTHFGILAEAAD